MFYYNGDKDELLKMIHDLMNPNSFFYTSKKPVDVPAEKICPQCGLSGSELYKKGKIGCAECVDTFRKELVSIIEHIQGRSKFSGRIPKSLAEEASVNVEELKEKLALAVAEERYEDAALYRDLIREQE